MSELGEYMTQSNEPTIEQMNEVIGVFMGGKWMTRTIAGRDQRRFYYEPETPFAFVKNTTNLNYHKDWNELMPVVEKIEKEYAHVRIQAGICSITHRFMRLKMIAKEKGIPMDEVMPIAEYNDKGFIGNVYHAIYDFITWLNQQTTTNERQPE